MRFKRSFPICALSVLVLTYTVFFSMMAINQHESLRTHVFDLGNVDQTLWNTVHGRPLHFTTQPLVGENRLGMHVEPILFLVALFYVVAPDPRVLLIVQTLGLALGAIPLYALARRRLGNSYMALAFPLIYLLLPALQATNLFEFHAVALAPLFLLATFYYLECATIRPKAVVGQGSISPSAPSGKEKDRQIEGRPGVLPERYSERHAWLGYALFLFLALCCKEDISLIIVLLGVYIVLIRRKWLPGVLTTLAGLLWFVIAVYVVIPHFRPSGSPFLEFYEGLGDNPIAIAWSLLTQPDLLSTYLFTPANALVLRSFLFPLLGLPILGFPLWVLAWPSLAISLFSENTLMHRMERYHYAAPMIPVMVASAVYGLAWLSRAIAGLHNKWSRHSLDCNGLAAVPNKTVDLQVEPVPCRHSAKHETLWSAVFVILMVAASLWYQYHRGFTPLSRHFSWPSPTSHDRMFTEVANLVPAEAVISAQVNLFPHLSQRERAYFWPDPREKEYMVLDVSSASFDNKDGAHEVLKRDVEQGQGTAFGWIFAQDGYLVLKKGVAPKPLPEAFYTFLKPEHAQPRYPMTVDFSDALRFLGFSPIYEREEEVRFCLYFQALRSPLEDYAINLYLVDAQGGVVGGTDHLQPALVWYPTSLWEPGETVEVIANTLPWWTGDVERYGVALGISEGKDAWKVGARLSPRVEQSEWVTPILSDGTLLQLASFHRSWELPYLEENRRQYEPPSMPNRLNVTFSDKAELAGYALENRRLHPGQILELTLFWKSLSNWDSSHKVFVHLYDPDGTVVAQQDGLPGEGRLPTTTWMSGEYVADTHHLPIGGDVPDGKYRLATGLYDAESLARLPVSGDSGIAQGDHVILDQEVEIVSR